MCDRVFELVFVWQQVHRRYTAADFDDDLRAVLRRSGCKDEKIVFILDESNILDSGFLERMNTLLANGEVTTETIPLIVVMVLHMYSLSLMPE